MNRTGFKIGLVLLCGHLALSAVQPARGDPALGDPAPSDPAPVEKADVLLQYDHAPIATVVRSLSDRFGKPLLGEVNVEGTVTFFDSRPYTLMEAFDTINLLLSPRGYRIMIDGRFLRVVPVAEASNQPLPLIHNIAEVDRLRPDQMAAMVLGLNHITAEQATGIAQPMVAEGGKVVPLPTGRGLLVTSRVANIRRICEMLALMDADSGDGGAAEIKSVKLENARARDVINVIDNLWGAKAAPRQRVYNEKRKRWDTLPPDPKDFIRTTHDERTNTLFLKGESSKLLLAEQMARRLDAVEGPAAGDSRVFALTNAKAADLADVVRRSLVGSRGRRGSHGDQTSIEADPSTNRIIVSGSVEQMDQAARLIEELDAASAESCGLRIFRLKAVEANQMADILRAATGKADRRGRVHSSLSITVENRSGALIVTGPPGDIQTAADLIEELDKPDPDQQMEVRVIALEAGDARQLAESLMRMLDTQGAASRSRRGARRGESAGKIRIEADTGSNSLLIAAPQDQWPRIDDVLGKLKAAVSDQAATNTYLIPLKSADAEQLADTLRQVFRSSGGREGRRRGQSRDAGLVIAASRRANALLVTAGAEDYAKLTALIAQLDVPDVSAADAVTIYELQAADAAKVAATLRAMLPRPQRGQAQRVMISFDQATNSVLVRAPAGERETIERMISGLDKATGQTARRTHVHPLQYASAQAMIPMLNQLYGQGDSRRRRSQAADDAKRVVITAAPGDKALVIDAPPQTIDQIVQLVAGLDIEGEALGKRLPRSYALTNADAAELARSLGRLFTQGRSNRSSAAALQPHFEAERNTNTLLVTATAEQYEIIESLINKMEADTGGRKMEARTFELAHAKAQDIAGTVSQVLATSTGDRSARGRTRATVNADARTNALIVTATTDAMEMAVEVIARLDTPEAAESVIVTKLIPLQNADGEQVAATLNAAMGAGGDPRSRRRGGGQDAGKLTAVAYAGARSILLTGRKADIEFAEGLIAEFDARAGVQTRTYSLQHARADSIAQTLRETVGAAQPRGRRGGPVATVRIAADPAANTVVVSAGPDVHETIAALLTELDSAEAAGAALKTRVVALENADATEMASTLNAALAGKADRSGRRGRSSSASLASLTGRELIVVANVSARSVLLTGSEADIAFATELIAQLDARPAADVSEVKTYPLRHASADRLATILRDTVVSSRGSGGRRRSASSVNVSADAGANAIIVSASPEAHRQVAALLAQLDTPEAAAARPTTKVVPVVNADPIELAQALADKNLNAMALPTARALLLTGPGGDIAAAEAIIAEVDSRPSAAQAVVETYALEHADAEEVARVLGETVGAGSARRSRRGSQAAEVRISANPAGRSVVVAAPQPVHQTVRALLAKLDTPAAAAGGRVVEVVSLMHAKAEQLAEALGAAQGSRRGRGQNDRGVQVAPVGGANALLLAGPADQVAQTKSLVAALDSGSARLTSDMQIFQLTHAKAEDLAQTLETMLTGSQPTNRRRRGEPAAGAVRVAAQVQTNSLVVQGAPEKIALAAQMIEQFDVADPQQRTVIEVVQLRNAQAWSLAEAVSASLGAETSGRRLRDQAPTQRVTVTAETNSNSVLVRGPASEVPEVLAMIARLDQSGTSRAPQLRTYRLENNDASDLALSLGDLFRDIIRQGPRGGGRGRDAEPVPFSISADTRTNSLVVSTSEAYFSMFEELLNRLERTEMPMRDVYYVPLINADAMDVTLKLDNLFLDRVGPDKPIIESDYYTNAVTIIAKDIDFKRIKRLIDSMDKVATSQVKVLPVMGMKADKLAAQLKILYPQVGESELKVVDKLPERPGERSAPADDRDDSIQPPPAAPGEADQPAILRADDTHVQHLPAAEADSADKPPVLIAVDKVTNSLIVSATRQELDNIQSLIWQLSMGAEMAEAEFRWFKIEHADPAAIAATLDELYNPKRKQQQKAAPKTKAKTDKKADDKERARPAPASPTLVGKPVITVAADVRTSHVIVRAKPAVLDEIAQIVAKLDQITTVVTEVRAFTLANSDATQVATNIRELFRLAATGRSAAKGKATAQKARADLVRQVIAYRLADQTRQVDIRSLVDVTANEATNSVIVSAPADAMEVIAGIIRELDQSAGESRRPAVRMYPVTAEDATALADTVQKVFASSRKPKGKGVSSVPVVVTANEAAKLLVVSAAPADQAAIGELIARLDAAGGAARTETILLKNIQAEDLAKTLGQIAVGTGKSKARAPVRIAAETQSNAVIISGPAPSVEKYVQMVNQLDVAGDQKAPGVFLLPLQRAKAAVMAGIVDDLYQRQVSAARAAKQSIEPMAVTADDRANVLVFACSAEKFEQMRQWVSQIEQMSPTLGKRLEVIQLENVDGEDVKEAIEQLFGGSSRKDGSGGKSLPFEMTVLPKERRLLLDASEQDMKVIRDLVAALEQAAKDKKPEARLFPLAHADNVRVAESLKQVFDGVARTGYPEDQVSVTALPKTTAVVVAAAPEKMADAERLIAQLDTPKISPTMEFRVYPLQYAEPTKVIGLLDKMLAEYRKDRPDEPITVVADERTRSIIVTAREPSFEQVKIILERIDIRPQFAAAEVAVVQLLRADAATLAGVLNEMLQPGKAGQVTPEARALQEQVKLLRVAAPDGDGVVELDLTRPIKISADSAQSGSNALILTSTADNVTALRAVIEIMDTVPVSASAKVKVVHLQNADAESAGKILSEIFTRGAKQLAGEPGRPTAGKAEPVNDQGRALVKPLNVSADPRTNSLVMSGAPGTLRLAEKVLKDLDRQSGEIITQVRLFKLHHADAARLAPVLKAVFAETGQGKAVGAEGLRTQVTRLVKVLDGGHTLTTQYPKGRAALTIQADETTNVLVVAARGDLMPLIADVIESMDIPGAGSFNTVRIFPLEHADAGRLAGVIEGLYKGPNAKLIRTEDLPTLQVDTRTNALIVSASEQTFTMISALLVKLDVETVDPSVQLTVIPLRHNDAGDVAAMLQKIFQARLTSMTPSGQTPIGADRVDVATDTLTNALIVSASKENLVLIQGLVDKIDSEPPAETGIVRMYLLENSDAQRVASMLGNLISQGLYKGGLAAAGGSKTLTAREKVSIVADVRTNVLIVSASPTNFAVIEQIIRRVDLTEDFGLLGDVRLYTLKRADATRLAPTLKQFFDSKRSAEKTTGGEVASLAVTIIADARTNTLLVAGSRESFSAVEAMIAKLDADQIPPASEFRIFHLKQATATAIQPMLDDLFKARIVRGSQRDPVTIVADPRSNTLIVAATGDDLGAAADLIARLDRSQAAGGETVRVFPLAKADAKQVLETLTDLYKRQGGPEAMGLNLSVDERTNAIVISGGQADIDRVGSLIRQLDTAAVPRFTEIRVFALRNADATEMAELLTTTLTTSPKSPTGENSNRQALLQFIRKLPNGEALASQALQEGVLIAANTRVNALVVTAPVDSMTLLANLIEALDSIQAPPAQIKAFVLRNADATQMATVLKDLFQLTNAPADSKAVSYTLVTTQPPPGADRAAATLHSAGQYTLTVTVDTRTNTLLVGGLAEYVKLAADVISELDSKPAQERVSVVYRLRNAKADEIEKAVSTWLDQERERLVRALGAENMGSAQRLLEHEVAVVAVQSTAAVGQASSASNTSNTLLISANPRYFETIERIIQQLDEPQPQVLVDVILAEVILDDTTDLGVDWNLSLKANGGAWNVNTGTRFGVQADILRPASGFNFSVTGGDFEVFLRALQSKGNLEVLSRPQILASDNQEAMILIGQEVPVVTSSRVTDTGTFNTVTHRKTGIQLTVTPRISPDGFVRMEVSPEISSLSTSSVQISEDLNAPVFNTREANTTVTVQDGHTIVIGGLIRTQDEQRDSKVPLLGDIPLLGALFRSTTDIKERTELLIILTPRIIRTGPDADRMSDEHIDQFNRTRRLNNCKPLDELLNRPCPPPVEADDETLQSNRPSVLVPPNAPAAPGQGGQ